jgi:hypothetical protein
MAPDERSRLQLAEAAKAAFGDDAGITLMELLPPVGWADVATRHDFDARFDVVEQRLGRLEQRMDALEREMRALTWKMMTLMVAVVGVVVAAVRL